MYIHICSYPTVYDGLVLRMHCSVIGSSGSSLVGLYSLLYIMICEINVLPLSLFCKGVC